MKDENDYIIDLTDYLTFTSQQDNSSIGLYSLSSYQTLEYSTDKTTWNSFDTTTNISLNNGDKVYIRGVLSADNTDSNYTQFKMSGKIAASGNCNTVWDYQDLNAPLKEFCGRYMFDSCSSLTTAPELHATTLADYCYNGMFQYCSSLVIAPELPATTLAKSCYSGMFQGCTSLLTAPELPAATLAEHCYDGMFFNCTSLTTAPSELPAATLVNECYASMFWGCVNLNYIKCLATNISASFCTTNWVNGVSSTGTFIKHPDMTSWSTGTSGIPSEWTIENAEL